LPRRTRRGYYGTVSHNVKAIYQRYLSWYDGNPANLNPLPPGPTGRKVVDYMGGADAIIAKAREDFARGEFRWVAQVLGHVVFAQPDNTEARELSAAAMEQLAFQAESSTWRNAYLMGAKELRQRVVPSGRRGLASTDMVRAMTLEMFFDFVGVRVNAARARGLTITVDWVFPDVNERWSSVLQHCALSYACEGRPPRADVTVTIDRSVVDEVMRQKLTMDEAAAAGRLRLDGDAQAFLRMWSVLDRFDPMFPIVDPIEGAP
jgi:alkyl sulfatase BDS1-like metallo-beta-lactamase superfamily hydrolase